VVVHIISCLWPRKNAFLCVFLSSLLIIHSIFFLPSLLNSSGCAGSHVVIRCHDQIVNDEIVKDAAALAARQSKCSGKTIKVSMCRARDVKKPPGAKAGLVQLTGSVRTTVVNMKEAEVRLNRLDKTCLVN